MNGTSTSWRRRFAVEFLRGVRDAAVIYPLVVLALYLAGALQWWWNTGHLVPLPAFTAETLMRAAFPAFVLTFMRGRPSHNIIPRLLIVPLATAVFALYRLYQDPHDWVVVVVAEIALCLLTVGLIYKWKKESEFHLSRVHGAS